jgi:hypothetical protein
MPEATQGAEMEVIEPKSPTKHAQLVDVEMEDLVQSQDVLNEQNVSVAFEDGEGKSVGDVHVQIVEDEKVKESATMTEIPTASVSVGTESSGENTELKKDSKTKSATSKSQKRTKETPSPNTPPFLPSYGAGNKSNVPGTYMKSFNVKLAPSQV